MDRGEHQGRGRPDREQEGGGRGEEKGRCGGGGPEEDPDTEAGGKKIPNLRFLIYNHLLVIVI